MKNRQMLGVSLLLEGKRIADIPTLPELKYPGRSHWARDLPWPHLPEDGKEAWATLILPFQHPRRAPSLWGPAPLAMASSEGDHWA